MISLEHVRALFDNSPAHISGRPAAFCDFAGPGDESVLAFCDGNQAQIVDAWTPRAIRPRPLRRQFSPNASLRVRSSLIKCATSRM